jgi:transposase
MGEARVVRPDRSQLRWDMIDLEGLLAGDHRARVVWSFVEGIDLKPLYETVGSREGEAGRPAADPAVHLALWLYATIEGVGSARELARLTERDVAYRWLAGGVATNYHSLADFRVGNVEFLDALLTRSVTGLIAEGLVSLDEVMLDGTKVRANASRQSYKKKGRLVAIEAAVGARLETLKRELSEDSAASSRRRQAAQERAAREVGERARRAQAAVDRLAAERGERAKTHAKDEMKKREPRASLSDPQARRMRFADGAVRPAYNAQIAATGEGLIVAIAMTDRRNDQGLAVPMVEDIAARYGRAPSRLLVDTKYATGADILILAEREDGPVTVYAPTPSEQERATPVWRARREAKRRLEPPALKEWRERMASAAGKAVYARRLRIERVNADRKNHGFGFLPVRGLVKAGAVALWHALAHNIMAGHRLRGERMAMAG